MNQTQGLKQLFTLLCVTVSLVFLPYNNAEAQIQSEPHRLIEQTTNQVLAFLETDVDPVNMPDDFVVKLSNLLEPVVAFDYIAKGVMGVHAKSASAEQVNAFAQAFKQGLVRTYGQGIGGFRELEFRVVPATQDLGDRRRATVVQEIVSSSGVINISYSMAKNRQGRWKVLNLILNGINFGKTFRSQFSAAVASNNGDLDKTITDWASGIK